MSQVKHTSHEPLLRLAKRDGISRSKAYVIRIVAVLLSLIVSGIFIFAVTKLNPLAVYEAIFDGAFGTPRRSWVTIRDTMMLLCIAVGLAPAFKMKFWNIGAEGQVLMGGVVTAGLMRALGGTIPTPVLLVIMAAASLLAGCIWGAIPATFKARWGTNETLFTLMMNYVAIQLVAYFIVLWEVPKGSGKVGIINQSSMAGWLPYLGTNSYLLIVIFVALITAGMYVYLNYSKHGYEITVVGESQRTASYVGIKVDKVIIRTLLLSGAICGFTGWMMVSGVDHTITTTLAGGRGFLGIMVSWLAQFNVVAIIFADMLIVFLEQGAGEISTMFGLNQSFADIITGIILFFIIGCEFFINYKVHVRKNSGKEEA